jgi:hypothetical protein
VSIGEVVIYQAELTQIGDGRILCQEPPATGRSSTCRRMALLPWTSR